MAGMVERAGRAAWIASVAAALLAVLAVRIVVMRASGAGLYVDEAQYWDWSRQLAWGYWSKPPGIAVLIALSTSLFGDGLTGVRVLSMACWPAAAGVLAWTAAQIGGRTAALWAAALFITTLDASVLGLVATTDAPLVLCWAIAFGCSWRAWQGDKVGDRTRAWWLAAGAATGIGLLAKYSMGAIVVSWAMLAWRGGRRTVRGVALACVLAGLLALPNLLWNAANGWPTFTHTAAITVNAAPPDGLTHVRSVVEYVVGQLLAWGPIALIVAAVCWRRRGALELAPQAGDASWFAWTFVWPFLAIGALQALHAKTQVNWTAPALLGACLWLALRADRAMAPRRALQFGIAGIALGSVLALAGNLQHALQGGWQLDPWARMRGWQEALSALRPVLDAHPGVEIAAPRRDLIAHADYIWRDANRPVQAWPQAGPPDNHFAQFRPLRGHADEVLVLSEFGPDEAMRAAYPVWTKLAASSSGRVTVQLWRGSRR
jgi:4-amino-4-deoxy-L-arabinose transferase-like glycosyltransferase